MASKRKAPEATARRAALKTTIAAGADRARKGRPSADAPFLPKNQRRGSSQRKGFY